MSLEFTDTDLSKTNYLSAVCGLLINRNHDITFKEAHI